MPRKPKSHIESKNIIVIILIAFAVVMICSIIIFLPKEDVPENIREKWAEQIQIENIKESFPVSSLDVRWDGEDKVGVYWKDLLMYELQMGWKRNWYTVYTQGEDGAVDVEARLDSSWVTRKLWK